MEIKGFFRVYKHSETLGWLPLMHLGKTDLTHDEAVEFWSTLAHIPKLRLVEFRASLDTEKVEHGVFVYGGKL